MPMSNAARMMARWVSSGFAPPKFCQSPRLTPGRRESALAEATVLHRRRSAGGIGDVGVVGHDSTLGGCGVGAVAWAALRVTAGLAPS